MRYTQLAIINLSYLIRIVNMQYIRKNLDPQKQLLLNVIGELIKEKRQLQNKGILLFSYEYDISNSSIALLEKGKRDVQITTLWKLANAFGMSFSEFIIEVEKRLPEDFKLIED